MEEPLPFSQACENNKRPILEVLRRHLTRPAKVLEVGAGTGQHAEFFAAELPWLTWQTTDLPENIASLRRRILHAGLGNLPPPLVLDVTLDPWPVGRTAIIFSANTLHIMPEGAVEIFMSRAAEVLVPGGYLLVYGPFRYQGEFTTPSNAEFDLWLKRRNPVSGIRDFERLDRRARLGGLSLLEDNAMPANNQLLVWQKG